LSFARRLFLAGLTASAIVAPAAHATGWDPLPLPAFGDMVVDDGHRRVFVSGGPSANGIAVADFSGRVSKTIDKQHGATGLALSEGGRTLYAALASGDAISAIDTETLKETARYATGAQTCPTHLARTGALVWFGYGCDDTWNGRIGRLDTSATPPTITLDQQGETTYQQAPFVTATGAANGPVLAGQLRLSLSNVHVYPVVDGKLGTGPSGEVVGSNLTELALSPDGATAYAASGSRDRVEGIATTDLSRRGSYASGPYANAAAASSDGGYIAVGAYTTRDKAISVYKVDGVTPVRAVGLDGDVLADCGLVWSKDNKRLFVILQRANDSRPRLAVVNNPAA
jgi:hypothetical protein